VIAGDIVPATARFRRMTIVPAFDMAARDRWIVAARLEPGDN